VITHTAADTWGERWISATTVPEADRFGWTTSTAQDENERLVTVYTPTGEFTTVNIMKMSPSPAWTTQVVHWIAHLSACVV